MTSLLIQRLCNVQKNLMSKNIEDNSLNNLLQLIFKECIKENMTFYFNFLENQVVLNLCDLDKEHNELHFRLSYSDECKVSDNTLKIFLLENTFLLTPSGCDVASSEDIPEEKETVKKEKPIQESNIVPPSAIRVAMEECEKQGEPVTRKNVENKLNLKSMSQDKRRQCIAYLRDMEA